MTYTYNTIEKKNNFSSSPLYKKVMLWVAAQFGLATIGVLLIGPLVPVSFITPLYLILLFSMIIASFSRKAHKLSPIMAIVVPLILGVTLYSTLNYFIATGAGDIVALAAGGTAIIFVIMALWGYTSKKNINSWTGKMFVILLSIIALSLLNAFLLHLTFMSLIISIISVVLFSIYIFIDIQRIRDNAEFSDAPASLYALNIFLDIYNIFVALLNILSIARR